MIKIISIILVVIVSICKCQSNGDVVVYSLSSPFNGTYQVYIFDLVSDEPIKQFSINNSPDIISLFNGKNQAGEIIIFSRYYNEWQLGTLTGDQVKITNHFNTSEDGYDIIPPTIHYHESTNTVSMLGDINNVMGIQSINFNTSQSIFQPLPINETVRDVTGCWQNDAYYITYYPVGASPLFISFNITSNTSSPVYKVIGDFMIFDQMYSFHHQLYAVTALGSQVNLYQLIINQSTLTVTADLLLSLPNKVWDYAYNVLFYQQEVFLFTQLSKYGDMTITTYDLSKNQVTSVSPTNSTQWNNVGSSSQVSLLTIL